MNIRISADSTCDLSPELIEKYDIRITPLYIVRDGQSLVDGKDITPDEIYAHVNSGGGMCSTAAVSVYDYTQFFRRQLEECDAVVHFHSSGDMSACYQNACIAAQEVGNVYPVDSRSLSTGIGQLVLEAAQLTREGKLTAQEIAHEMERRRELLDVSFLVERLDFLHKGGRCSGVALLGANMLNLRPCIQVKDGQMMVGKKYRGPYVSCLLQYIRERLKGRDDIDTRRIFITESGGFTPEELAQVEAAVRSCQPFD
ncbi:MAG: DegV family protein, partial [Oscillospiraceae bacterium]|nr:DegV family protein [Oscillospiraceae bacterium]